MNLKRLTTMMLGSVGLVLLTLSAMAQPPLQMRKIPQNLRPKTNTIRPERNKPTENYFKGKLPSQTQEMLADVVLQETMNQVWVHADRHGHEGEYNHYINICRMTVEANPAFYSAYDTAAHLLWSTDRMEEGLELLKRGLQANPNDYYFYDEIGQHYMLTRKDHKTAISYYEQAIKYKCPWMTHNMLATCYEKTNQLDKAITALERAATYPDNPRGRVRLERMRRELERRKGSKG
jgi:tetratricopeptide (TPR) repeat protein